MTTTTGTPLHDRAAGCNSTVDLQCAADKHDTRAAYLSGCRCPGARESNRNYAHYRKQRTAQAAFGAAPPFSVSVDDTQSVMEQLRGLGWTVRRIEATTGIGRGHLARINGRTGRPLRRVRWATHQRLAALLDREPIVAGAALIDAYPTWQRIHGLIALGYPKTWIAQQIGSGRALQLDPYRVLARNAEKVRALADTYGATPGPSAAARRYAEQHGWTPDMLWQADDDANPDDADDLDEIALELACAGEPTNLTSTERLEAARRLQNRGLPVTHIAERLRVSGHTVNTLLAQIGQHGRQEEATA